MNRDIKRLLRPRRIAVVGGGPWNEQVAMQTRRAGFDGEIMRVHPKGKNGVYSSLKSLPVAPDAAFLGVNRHATIESVETLAKMGAGGAVCFASGFAETAAEDRAGTGLQSRLVQAAGGMTILGPNCYGFINALDGVALWPDQHGCQKVARGVAIVTQSSNIAVNLTMQTRALPIAYVITCGNMAQTGQATIAEALLDDDRVTAIGLHIEGFSDLRAWEGLARRAFERGVPLVALKVGRSAQARAATLSHTASLAGADAGAQALLDRLAIARVTSLGAFLETLKLLHFTGLLASDRIASLSCSGGEAALVADTAGDCAVTLPGLNRRQERDLRDVLGPKVALANPLDYHTYIWRDTDAMTRTIRAMIDPSLALTMLVADYPRADMCDASDWQCVTDAALAARAQTGANLAVVATLPELMPETVAKTLAAGGVVPLAGLDEALRAVKAAANLRDPNPTPILAPGQPRAARLVDEARAKTRLAEHGLDTPLGNTGSDPSHLAGSLAFPVVLKALGHAHKSEIGAVAVGLSDTAALIRAAQHMGSGPYLVEEMVTGCVAELLVGITRDPAHGFLLTVGAGGTMAELLGDVETMLIPVGEQEVKQALTRLNIGELLAGYRGAPGADVGAIVDAVLRLQSYAIAKAGQLEELEVNPLICTPSRAVVADALLKEAP